MIQNNILTDLKMPFCQGCGHGIIVKNLASAIEAAGYSEHDVVIVSDIGCSGLVDPLFNTHSVHGLHGRAPALGVGVSLGMDNPDKKVIVIQGDGGVTIGLQHVLEAARRNVNMTLVVMNNLLYGMTGGQISGLSTQKFKEQRHFELDVPPFDIVKLAHLSGAAFSARATSIKTFPEVLSKALSTKGFSLVEMSSLCTSYAYKKLNDLLEVIEEPEILENKRHPAKLQIEKTKSLLENLKIINYEFQHNIESRFGIVIAGSAGGGVQSAATMLASAGLMSGLHTSMKGEYPVTVGTGFSIAEVILSKDKVNYTGLENPDVVIIVSDDGLRVALSKISKETLIIADENLKTDLESKKINNKIQYGNFNLVSGKKGAALTALSFWINQSKKLMIDSLIKTVSDHRLSTELLIAIQNENKITHN